MKIKKWQKITIGIIVSLVLIMVFKGNLLSITTLCTLGGWNVDSYNSQTGELVLSASNSRGNAVIGCWDQQTIKRDDTPPAPIIQAECAVLEWHWNEDLNKCYPVNKDWFKNYAYTNNIACSYLATCESCGGLPCTVTPLTPSVSFDGEDISINADAGNLCGGKVTCSGSLSIKPIQVPPICTSDNCISPCDGKTASCVSGTCVISGECIEPPKPITLYLIIGGILIGVGLLTLVYFKVMRKKRR